ncbi:MAG: HAD-IC family P-type ATPase, partial [Ruminococcus sp.]|nr:HAD-IC family P-type ATPase [Ruminococcus sp.]
PQAIKELKNMGIKVVMLTGDNRYTADAIGAQAGVDEVIAEVLPDGKESIIQKLKKKGKVAMVGDGINDAPALTSADMGIAVGAGTDVAIDAADVVLMKSKLTDVSAAIRLSRATLRNIHENLFWAFIYNVIGIPLAAGAYIKLFGWELNPMFGAAAMSLSSFCVVSNALRLNWLKVHDAGKDKKLKNVVDLTENSSGETLAVTVMVKGMMCGHCEARVKKALEELPFVDSAEVSHEKGSALVHAAGAVDRKVIKEAIKKAGYKVTGFKE